MRQYSSVRHQLRISCFSPGWNYYGTQGASFLHCVQYNKSHVPFVSKLDPELLDCQLFQVLPHAVHTTETSRTFHGSRPIPRVGSGGSRNLAGRIGSGQEVVRTLTDQNGSGQEVSKYHDSIQTRPDPTRER